MPSYQELRAAVPPRCFRPSTGRSLAHLARDLTAIGALYAAGVSLADRGLGWLWPVLWFGLGTLFWALFLIGHDCGHGAFSRHRWLNTLVGHLTHTPLLVPYHGWRLSHRLHHRGTGHVDRDETWFPLTRAEVAALPWHVRLLRFRLFLFGLPFYLLRRSPGRAGSHFNPQSALFPRREQGRVTASIALCGLFAAGLVGAACWWGPGAVCRYYLAPYVVFAVWLDLVTILHHTSPDVPWYRDPDWTPLHGALATVDRHYGLFEAIHHHVGTHVPHHLFPHIPHYRLRQASVALARVLGPAYRRPGTPIWRAFADVLRSCHVVPPDGSRVFYEPYAPVTRMAPVGSGLGSRPATR